MKFVLKYLYGNKIKSFLVSFSFLICITIIIISSSLVETISNLENLQREYQNTPYNVIIKNAKNRQYEAIKDNKEVKALGLESFIGSSVDKKYLYQVVGTNSDNLLSTSMFIKGGLFKKENDVILEKWTLDYLGLKPNINQKLKISYKNESGKIVNEECNICGIIHDTPTKKNIGVKTIYKNIKDSKSNDLSIKLEYKRGTRLFSVLDRYQSKYRIEKNNISINASSPEEVSEILSSDLDINNIMKSAIFSLLCILIVFSIINMSIRDRINLYSLIKAMGAKKQFIFKSIFYELLILYMISIPIGLFISNLFTKNIVKRLRFTSIGNIYIHNKIANLSLIVNYKQIFADLTILLLFILVLSYIIYRKIKRIDIISGMNDEYDVKKNNRFTKNIYLNYLIKDASIIITMVITMSMLSSYYLMIGFNAYMSREEEKMMVWDMYAYSDIKVAATDKDLNKSISKSEYEELNKIKGIRSIDYSRFIPGKIIYQDKWKINDAYFSNINENSKDEYWKEYFGINEITKKKLIKASVRAYNDESFIRLAEFKTSGSFDIKKLKEANNAIVVVPKTDDNNFKNLPDGKNVVDIKPGDDIEVMTPKDSLIDMSYYDLNDDLSKYTITKFKVVGIAYGTYFENARERTNPTLNIIITDKKFSNIYKIKDFRNFNIYAKDNYDIDKLYSKIDKVFLGRKNIVTRNIRSELNQINQINSRKKIFNISVIVSLLMAILFSAINSTSSLYEVNKNDISIIKKIGASKKKIYKCLILEWIFISLILIFTTFIISKLSQYLIYYNKGIYYEGIQNIYDYKNLICISMVNSLPILFVLLCETMRSE